MPDETQELFQQAVKERGVDLGGETSKIAIFEKTAKAQGFGDEEIAPFLSLARRAKGAPGVSTEPSRPSPTGFDPSSLVPLRQGAAEAGILPTGSKLTQRFGAFNPRVEKFSGGVNLGADFSVTRGTPLQVPQGTFVVEEVFNGAREGNRGTNSGFGNSVKVKNLRDGTTLRFSHLTSSPVKPGQLVRGGETIAFSGSTGNSTGPHASILTTDATGRPIDVFKSQYAQSLFRS